MEEGWSHLHCSQRSRSKYTECPALLHEGPRQEWRQGHIRHTPTVQRTRRGATENDGAVTWIICKDGGRRDTRQKRTFNKAAPLGDCWCGVTNDLSEECEHLNVVPPYHTMTRKQLNYVFQVNAIPRRITKVIEDVIKETWTMKNNIDQDQL